MSVTLLMKEDVPPGSICVAQTGSNSNPDYWLIGIPSRANSINPFQMFNNLIKKLKMSCVNQLSRSHPQIGNVLVMALPEPEDEISYPVSDILYAVMIAVSKMSLSGKLSEYIQSQSKMWVSSREV